MPVEITRRGGGNRPASRRLRALAIETLRLLKQDDAELSIALVDDAEMRALNSRYRDRDYPTDVLSFPADAAVPGGAALLGDVVICAGQARRQARDAGTSLEEEVTRLLIHGVLHLLGYDHERSELEARRMRRRERELHRALCGGAGKSL